LAPVVLFLVLFMRPKDPTTGRRKGLKYRAALDSFPLFILGFFLVILYNTILPSPGWLSSPLSTGKSEFLNLNVANILLTAAIVGICFRVKREVVGKSGLKILAVGGIAWLIQSFMVFWLCNILPIPHL
jgi:uncharacterized membrane protein YadS